MFEKIKAKLSKLRTEEDDTPPDESDEKDLLEVHGVEGDDTKE